jgi:hypothetical protein
MSVGTLHNRLEGVPWAKRECEPRVETLIPHGPLLCLCLGTGLI